MSSCLAQWIFGQLLGCSLADIGLEDGEESGIATWSRHSGNKQVRDENNFKVRK